MIGKASPVSGTHDANDTIRAASFPREIGLSR